MTSHTPRLRVFRVVVDAWPTDDGQPWERFYGEDPALDGQRIDPDDPMPEEIPDWLMPTLEEALPHRYGTASDQRLSLVAARLRWRPSHPLTDADPIICGVVMPKVSRANYLSASGAYKLLHEMRAFGATARLLRSAPVADFQEVSV